MYVIVFGRTINTLYTTRLPVQKRLYITSTEYAHTFRVIPKIYWCNFPLQN